MKLSKEQRRAKRLELSGYFGNYLFNSNQVEYLLTQKDELTAELIRLGQVKVGAEEKTPDGSMTKKVDASLRYTNLMTILQKALDQKKEAIDKIKSLVEELIQDTPEELRSEINDYYINEYINRIR